MAQILRLRFGISIFAVACLLTLACSDDDIDDPADQAKANANVCADVARSRESVNNAMRYAVTFNESKLQDALPIARSDLDSLGFSVREAQGGGASQAMEQLGEDIQEFQRLMATPQLSTVLPQLQNTAREINQDLDAIAEEHNCPI